jgi:hypothetical protein
MEVFVRGARSSSRDWSAAQRAPLNELPQLDDEQKAEARRGNLSEEAYARTFYAQQLTAQAMLRRLLKFGKWLDAEIEGINSECRIDSVELNTWEGMLHIQGKSEYDSFSFDLDEDVVERFLTTGSADLEAAILRVVEIFLPRGKVARAS